MVSDMLSEQIILTFKLFPKFKVRFQNLRDGERQAGE